MHYVVASCAGTAALRPQEQLLSGTGDQADETASLLLPEIPHTAGGLNRAAILAEVGTIPSTHALGAGHNQGSRTILAEPDVGRDIRAIRNKLG